MLVKQLHVRPCAEMYGRTLTDTLQAQQTQKKKSAACRPNLWRFIMENKITRYSAAAIVTLAMALVLLGPFGTSDSGHIVWAQVVQNMDKVQMFVHKEQRFYYELGEDEPFLKTDVIKHACPKYGVVEEQYTTEGDLMHRAYLLGEARQIVGVVPKVKKYFKAPMTDTMAQLIDRLTPRGLVEYFMAIEHKNLGRSRIDGHEVEGFEAMDTELWPIHDTFRFLFPVRQITWRFWIDVESSLPVRAEYEIITDRGLFTEMKKLKIVCKAYAFEYHKEVQEELFDPNIPDDYTELNLTDLMPVKAGLVGLGVVPAGFVLWRRQRRKRAAVSRN